jgi:imidazole glycerol-phosphate synthase subunit HisH
MQTITAGNNVTIIDYKVGNIRSVANAFEAIGADVKISNQLDDLYQADYLVLPGVGAFQDGMKNLEQLGLMGTLNNLVLQERKPFLGICLGMQLLAKTGWEDGQYEGLGWIDAQVTRLDVDHAGFKVPHVGWNDVTSIIDNSLLGPANSVDCFYFLHSYHMIVNEPSVCIGTCNYGAEFTAIIQKDNIFAVQFHPEKSQKSGLRLLKNFMEYSNQNTRNSLCLKHV